MNQELTIIFFDDYFVCTILPNENAWETLQVNGSDRQLLYFYVKNNTIRNDDFARERFEANDSDAYGNFYSIITESSRKFRRFDLELETVNLLKDAIEQIKVVYAERIVDFVSSIDVHEKIALNVCFIPGIGRQSQNIIIDFLANEGFSITDVDYFESILEILFRKRVIPGRINFSIVESYFGDLWMHYVEFDRKIIKQSSDCLVGKGVDHRVGNLAKLIVEKAAKRSSSQILFDNGLFEAEVKRFHRRAETEIGNFLYDELDIVAELSDYNKVRVLIDMRELDKMSAETFQFIKFKYESFISKYSNLARTEKIFLNGGALSSPVFVEFFERTFGSGKIIKPFDNFIELLSRGIASISKPLSGNDEQAETIEINITVTKRPPLPPSYNSGNGPSKSVQASAAPAPPLPGKPVKPSVPQINKKKPPVPEKKGNNAPQIPPSKPINDNIASQLRPTDLSGKGTNNNGQLNGSPSGRKPPPPPPIPKKKQ